LRKHKKIHGDPLYECAHCLKRFKGYTTLHEHELLHFPPQFSCEHCDKKCHQKQQLRAHKRTHTGERPYGCTQCGKTYIRSSHLYDHMRLHEGDRLYACTKCDKMFPSASYLYTHNVSHTSDSTFPCDQCDKIFKALTTLKLHTKRIHCGSKYVCTECNKVFTIERSLHLHSSICLAKNRREGSESSGHVLLAEQQDCESLSRNKGRASDEGRTGTVENLGTSDNCSVPCVRHSDTCSDCKLSSELQGEHVAQCCPVSALLLGCGLCGCVFSTEQKVKGCFYQHTTSL